MDRRYGVVGTNQFSVNGHVDDGQEWVQVVDERPTINHILNINLTWDESTMKVWIANMEASDALYKLDRAMEDHITNAHSGVTAFTFTQNNYDAKVALRATKPV